MVKLTVNLQCILLYLSVCAISTHTDRDKREENNADSRKLINLKDNYKGTWNNEFKKAEREGQCPLAEDIIPCECSYNSNLLVTIDCSFATTRTEIEDVFAIPFPVDDMHEFYMYQGGGFNSSIDSMPFGIFNNKTFKRIVIHSIGFPLSLDTFDDMTETLEYIDFYKVPIPSMVKYLTVFPKLVYIELSYTQLSEFYVISPYLETLIIFNATLDDPNDGTPFDLGEMENLRKLEIKETKLDLLPNTSLYPLLNEYNAYSNNISMINSNSFTEAYLTQFDARYNQIQEIEFGSLQIAENGNVYLHANQLSVLPQVTWENIFENASSIQMTDNPFECGCDLPWLFGTDTNGIIYMDKLSGFEQCNNGTYFSNLTPDDFANC